MDWQDEYERKKITVNQVFEQHLTGNQKIYTAAFTYPPPSSMRLSTGLQRRPYRH